MYSIDTPNLPSRIRHHRHSVQFYGDESKFLTDLGRYVGAALGHGDSAVVIATHAHRAELKKRLHGNGFDTAYPRLKRRYIELDAAHTLSQFMVDGLPDPASFSEIIARVLVRARVAAEGENPKVVAFGEMVALLWAQGSAEAAVRLERLWNDLAHTNSFSLHCAYPRAAFAPDHEDQFLKICAEHSQVISSDDELVH